MLPRQNFMIYLAAYDPNWAKLFQIERQEILAAIGQYVAKIEHIGSTSIPDLCAKPVIDILVGVHRLADFDELAIEKLTSQGYEYVEKYNQLMPERRFFQKSNQAGMRTHQIHLVQIDGDFWHRHLLFRDYLRSHPEEAKQYQKLKQALALKYSDSNEYAGAKTEFCQKIHLKAQAWVNSLLS